MKALTFRQIAAEAHWQLGRTENHGGWFERILVKRIREFQPDSKEAWLQCVLAAHVKNQMIQSYGYTPHQFVFGKQPMLPGDLLNEPVNIVASTSGLFDQSVAHAQALRTAARKAVIELQDDRSLRRALLARPRVSQDFAAGGWRSRGILASAEMATR